ncbi:autotransporter assembly complex protein TamA [Alteromonas aestuariivivens]|uniref:autotransporter assembly complex protein TamA n=1 Tax=Alteromonas aestuariivivens TaxID=1938339 RepID=UPI001FEA6540|nr:autotransporter assembly complex family protein [Alteromonas aestuariivivens]
MTRFANISYLLALVTLILLCARNTWAIEFTVDGVEADNIRENIELHLKNLNVDNDLLNNPFWQNEIRMTVAKAAEPFGYYNSYTNVSQQSETRLALTVYLGTPLKVANVTREIIGNGREDPVFRDKFNAFPLKPGDIMLQPRYEAFKTSMFNHALSNGYFDFFWQATRLDLVRETREANILLIAQSGPRYQFGALKFVGDDKARAIINRLRPFSEGELYSSEQLTEFNRRLLQSGYFSRIIARPVVSEADNLKVPIEVSIQHKPRDTFNVGLGAATDTGPRIRLRWDRPWVNSRGHSVSSELFLSKPEQSLVFDYRIPMQNVTSDYLSFQAGYQFIEYSNTSTESETLSLSAHRFWQKEGSPWQQDGSLTYLRENYKQGLDPEQTTQLVMPGYALTYLDKNHPLFIDRGTYFQAFVQAGQEGFGSDIDFAKATVETRMVRTSAPHRFILRAELGAIDTNDFSRVPSSLRFFAGGDQSIRGFQYRDISPTDSVFNPITGEYVEESIGARYLITSSIEYGYRVAEKWQVALFADAGTATNHFEEDVAVGLGSGFNWSSPIGPVRVYVARGFSELENSWRLHIILGPEL